MPRTLRCFTNGNMRQTQTALPPFGASTEFSINWAKSDMYRVAAYDQGCMQALNKFLKHQRKACGSKSVQALPKAWVKHENGEHDGGIRLTETGHWALAEGLQREGIAVILCGNHKHWKWRLGQSEAACLCTWTAVWGSRLTLSPCQPHLGPRHRSTSHQDRSSSGCRGRMGRTAILNSCKKAMLLSNYGKHKQHYLNGDKQDIQRFNPSYADWESYIGQKNTDKPQIS